MPPVKLTRYVNAVALGGVLLGGLSGCGGAAKKMEAENEALRAQLNEMAGRAEAEAQANSARLVEVKGLQADVQDLLRLRGEVTRLRALAKESEGLRAENQRLKAENQAMRGATAAASPATTKAAPGHFPRESWSYAGYQSPEAALVSALYSMQQGNPKQYFESLTAEEQQRMAKVWENKTAEEISAKHMNDTAKITGMKVLTTQEVAPGQMVMSVFIEGIDRAEKVSMKLVDGEWKFGGYVREPAP